MATESHHLNSSVEVAAYYDHFGDRMAGMRSGDEEGGIHTGLYMEGSPESSTEAMEKMNRMLAKMAGLKGGEVVAVMGCGRGDTDRFLVKNYGVKIKGFDISPAQLEAAKKKCHAEQLDGKIEYQEASMAQVPLPEKSVDCVWAQESFYYLSPEEKVEAVKGFGKILKPGGKVILEETVALPHGDIEETSKIFRRHAPIKSRLLTPEEYYYLFLKAGLEVGSLKNLSEDLKATYRHIVDNLRFNEDTYNDITVKDSMGSIEDKLGYSGLLKLAEENRLGCYAFRFNKPADYKM